MNESTKPRFSYTALDTDINCPFAFYLKYIAKKRPKEQTLALEFGTLLHKVREECSLGIMHGNLDYERLKDILYTGWRGKNKSNPDEDEDILGVNALQVKYKHEWNRLEESIPSYNKRVENFLSHLSDEEHDLEWDTIGAEMPFEINHNGVTLFGVIDKVRGKKRNLDSLGIVDYKSSKKPYGDDKLKSPLQMYIYYLALKNRFPEKEISSFVYDFIALGEQRSVESPGWISRAENKLSKILFKIKQSNEEGVWAPKPSPLCYWCPYCKNNPNSSSEFNFYCDYYSLWRPNSKVWYTNRQWPMGEKAEDYLKEKEKNNFWF